MSIKIVLSDPMPGLDLPETMELGPFHSVWFEGGYFYGDEDQVAEVFEETMDDVMGHFVGHPAAGKIFVPRTFHTSESDDHEYPGKPYGCAAIQFVKED